MSTNSKWLLAAVASGALLVVGQAGAFAADTSKPGPAKVEKIDGLKVARVTLIQSAVDRLGLETAPVREEAMAPRKPVVAGVMALTIAANAGEASSMPVSDATQTLPSTEARKIVPYSAVIYDLGGNAWVYVNTEPRTYVRHPITIEYSQGADTVLKDGPPAGTPVVSIGAAELFGAETGVK
jgi:hypothetical protein